MNSGKSETSRPIPAEPSIGQALSLCALTNAVRDAGDQDHLLFVLQEVARALGITDLAYLRSVEAVDGWAVASALCPGAPEWGKACLYWLGHDPAAARLAETGEPLFCRILEAPQGMIDLAAPVCAEEILIVPAPSPWISSRVAVLCLAGRSAASLDAAHYYAPLLQALTITLANWSLAQDRRSLLERTHLNEQDIELLRHEASGQGSKVIADHLHTQAKTIDCRFQRLNVRLGVSNRREAVRLCRIYGVL